MALPEALLLRSCVWELPLIVTLALVAIADSVASRSDC